MEKPNDARRVFDQREIAGIARAYVEHSHPDASASILGGSAAGGAATPTSDLDIAVLYPDGHSNYALTTRFQGWLVEAFVHTATSLEFWYRKEASERRPVIAELCASGVILTDSGPGDAWQSRARELMAGGPKPLTEAERGSRRYDLSALIDDLAGSQHHAETFILTADVFRETANLLLLETGNWLGGGKWVIRRLASSGNDLASRLEGWAGDPRRDPESLAALAREVLEGSGGYIQEGFMRGKAGTIA